MEVWYFLFLFLLLFVIFRDVLVEFVDLIYGGFLKIIFSCVFVCSFLYGLFNRYLDLGGEVYVF